MLSPLVSADCRLELTYNTEYSFTEYPSATTLARANVAQDESEERHSFESDPLAET